MCSASEGKPQPLAITRSEGKGLRRRGNISLWAVMDLLKTSTLKEVTRDAVTSGAERLLRADDFTCYPHRAP